MKSILKYPFSALITVVIIALSTLQFSGETAPIPTFKGMDKCVHLIMYAVLAFTLMGESKKNKKRYPFLIGGGITAFLGGAMEWIQHHWIPYRSGDWKDMVANVIGTLLAMLIFWLYEKSKH